MKLFLVVVGSTLTLAWNFGSSIAKSGLAESIDWGLVTCVWGAWAGVLGVKLYFDWENYRKAAESANSSENINNTGGENIDASTIIAKTENIDASTIIVPDVDENMDENMDEKMDSLMRASLEKMNEKMSAAMRGEIQPTQPELVDEIRVLENMPIPEIERVGGVPIRNIDDVPMACWSKELPEGYDYKAFLKDSYNTRLQEYGEVAYRDMLWDKHLRETPGTDEYALAKNLEEQYSCRAFSETDFDINSIIEGFQSIEITTLIEQAYLMPPIWMYMTMAIAFLITWFHINKR